MDFLHRSWSASAPRGDLGQLDDIPVSWDSPLPRKGNAQNRNSQNPLSRRFPCNFCKREALAWEWKEKEKNQLFGGTWTQTAGINSSNCSSLPGPLELTCSNSSAGRGRDGAPPVTPEPLCFFSGTLWCPPQIPSSGMINVPPGC